MVLPPSTPFTGINIFCVWCPGTLDCLRPSGHVFAALLFQHLLGFAQLGDASSSWNFLAHLAQ